MRTIEQREAEFERTFEVKALADWRYYTADSVGGENAVLLLPGGVGIGISWVDLALALSRRYRTITVDYPPSATTFAALSDGILDVLDVEGVGRVHVVGQSAGGMLAEVLTQRAPGRVASIVFSGTGLYGPEDVDRLGVRLAAIQDSPWSPSTYTRQRRDVPVATESARQARDRSANSTSAAGSGSTRVTFMTLPSIW